MRSHRIIKILGFVFALAVGSSAYSAGESPQFFNFEGKLTDNVGTPINAGTATFTFTILDPSENCVLYQEQQAGVNMAGTGGLFSLVVGSATSDGKRMGDDPNHSMADIFQNVSNISATNGGCPGSTYSPSSGDHRQLRVHVNNGGSINEVIGTVPIHAAPSAVVAESVQGLDRSKLLEIGPAADANATQTNFMSLIDGSDVGTLHNHDSDYAPLDVSGNMSMPAQKTVGMGSFTNGQEATLTGGLGAADEGKMWWNSENNQMMYWDGGAAQSLSTSGGVTTVFSRSGAVIAAASDYDAIQIDNTPAGGIAATNVQAALDELDTEKLALVGGNLSGPINMGDNSIDMGSTGAKILNLLDPTNAQEAATMNYVDSEITANNASYVAKAGDNMTGALTFDAQNELRFADDAGGDYISFKAPSGMSSNYDYTLPPNYGTNTHVLTTDGSGGLTWSAKTTDNNTQNTLDLAYDHGGAGAGRSITVDTGAIQFTGSNAADETLEVTNSGNGGALLVENTGTGASFRVNDEAADSSPFVVNADGKVGVGTSAVSGGAVLEISGVGTASSSIILPRDTTANQPAAVNGMIRYNTSTNKFEGVENGAWVNLNQSAGGGGDLNNNGNGGIVRVGSTDSDTFVRSGFGDHVEFDSALGDTFFDTNTLVIDSSANRVGVGTASPVHKLTNFGNTAEVFTFTTTALNSQRAGYRMGLFNTTDSWEISTIRSSNELEFRQGSHGGMTTRMVLTDDGDIGISRSLMMVGTSAPAASVAGEGKIYFDSTANKFLVSENGSAFVDLVGGGGTMNNLIDDLTPQLGGNLDVNGSNIFSGAGLDIDIGAAAGNDFTVDTNKLVVEGDTGNVGIGNVAPTSSLDLNGAYTMQEMAAPAVSASGDGRIYFDSTSKTFRVSEDGAAYVDLVSGAGTLDEVYNSGAAFVTVDGSGGGDVVWNLTSTNDFRIQDNGTDAFVVQDDGRISMGSASPSGTLRLGVNGKVGATDFCSNADADCFTASDITNLSSVVSGNTTSLGNKVDNSTMITGGDGLSWSGTMGGSPQMDLALSATNPGLKLDGTSPGKTLQANIDSLTTIGTIAPATDKIMIHDADGADTGLRSVFANTFLIQSGAFMADGTQLITGNSIFFNNSTDKVIGVQNSTSTDGMKLTVQAGGSTQSGGSGGDLELSSGLSNGTGHSDIVFKTYDGSTHTTQMIVTGKGKVGVGDTTPDHTFDVDGNIGLTSGGYINFGDTTDFGGYGIRDNSGTIEFRNSSGSWAPMSSFDDGLTGSGTTGTIPVYTATADTLADSQISQDASNVKVTSRGFRVGSNFSINAAGTMVGIGTTGPSSDLHIKRANGSGVSAVIENTATSSGARSMLNLKVAGDFAGDAFTRYEADGSDSWSIGLDNSDENKFKISNSNFLGGDDVVTINDEGLVGIGTDDPLIELDVVGEHAGDIIEAGVQNVSTDSGSVAQFTAYNDAAEGFSFGITSDGDGGEGYIAGLNRFQIQSKAGDIILATGSGPTTRLRVANDGALTVNGATTINAATTIIGTTSITGVATVNGDLSATGYVKLGTTSTDPDASDCDTSAEHGRVKVDPDSGDNILFVCTADGWQKYKPMVPPNCPVGFSQVNAGTRFLGCIQNDENAVAATWANASTTCATMNGRLPTMYEFFMGLGAAGVNDGDASAERTLEDPLVGYTYSSTLVSPTPAALTAFAAYKYRCFIPR